LAQWEQFGKRRNKEEERKNERINLTLTGLLIEGVKARNYTLAKQTALPAAFGQNPQKRVEIQ
jgi:hypothetical protein